MLSHFRYALAAAAGVSLAARAAAQDTIPHKLPPVVTVTRDVGRSPLDLPYAISSLVPDSVAPGQSHTLLEQTLSLLPGVTVANRTNPSQDTRVSVRGFGARSQFGARSIRILRDGMPLTLPDGQTPIDYLDLESVGRVEVIRGTASALYGNASGGVIDLRSVDPPADPFAVQGRSWRGSYGLERYVGLFGGSVGSSQYEGNIGRTLSDGYRAYSHQRLTNAFLRATSDVAGTHLALTGLGMDMPVAENPGAITLAQFDSAPNQADPQSVLKRARKAVHQVQLGLSGTRPVLAGGEATAQVYGGTRSLYNPQTFATVGVDRRQGGASARVTLPWTVSSLANRLSVGADAQFVNDARKNWANCNGIAKATTACPVIGVDQGNVSLDQREIVSSLGPYVRDEIDVGRARGSVGVRADEVRFEVQDHFNPATASNSGTRTMQAVSPMLGIAARLSALHSVYANVGSAFETPTTTELGNQADGSTGLNRSLKPQYSTTYETGAKGLAFSRLQYDAALFDIELRDELIPFQVANGNGRTFYENAGRTRRQGVELALNTSAGPVTLAASYTLSHFRFVDFVNGASQFAGNVIPGVPEHQLQADATWRIRDAYVVGEAVSKSRVFVNDANAATAPAFTILNARVGGVAAFGKSWLSPTLAVQNLTGRHYVGSVAINATGTTVAATKFYEPSAGRTILVGLSAATAAW